jgi:hypothetical protein
MRLNGCARRLKALIERESVHVGRIRDRHMG